MRDPVQEQLEAYNTRDLARFLACFAVDVSISKPDGTVMVDGIEQMRDRYGDLFAHSTDLRAEKVNRVHAGSWVVDEERVRLESRLVHLLVAYEVTDEVITRVVMLR